MSEENKALVQSFLDRANRERRTPAELCAPGFTAHIRGSPPMDLAAFARFQEAFYGSFSDVSIALGDVIAEGDKVAFRGVVRATHTAEFVGIPASGTQISVTTIGMARVAGGKIAEWWNSPDNMGLMEQIGAVFGPRQPAT